MPVLHNNDDGQRRDLIDHLIAVLTSILAKNPNPRIADAIDVLKRVRLTPQKFSFGDFYRILEDLLGAHWGRFEDGE